MRRLFRKRKNRNGRESGQAIVEFALALPILLTLLCGILDFGWIYANQYSVENAAFVSARYAALHMTEESPARVLQDAGDRARSALRGNTENAVVTVLFGDNSVSVTVEYPVKTLTYVAGILYGSYYTATSTSVSAY